MMSCPKCGRQTDMIFQHVKDQRIVGCPRCVGCSPTFFSLPIVISIILMVGLIFMELKRSILGG